MITVGSIQYCYTMCYVQLVFVVGLHLLASAVAEPRTSLFHFQVFKEANKFNVELAVPFQKVRLDGKLVPISSDQFDIRLNLSGPIDLQLSGSVNTNWLHEDHPHQTRFFHSNLICANLFGMSLETQYFRPAASSAAPGTRTPRAR